MNIKPVVLKGKGKVNADGRTNIKIRIYHQRKTRCFFKGGLTGVTE